MSSSSSIFRRPQLIIAVFTLIIVLFAFFSWNHEWSSAKSFAESLIPHRYKRPNGVICMLLPPSRVQQTTLALKNIEDHFNRKLKYPYVLFMVEGEYDEVTEVQKERIAHITEGRAKFGGFFPLRFPKLSGTFQNPSTSRSSKHHWRKSGTFADFQDVP
ncbi:hypothetical protein C0992_006771 [Termitomyces sp. T32_za158]|nr:hypothetical protein C0992_006771 [Termitomyces sp. T32_za158]